ncbi:MAG: tetraacyldisaccharide 4'-kinase, partial [Candidatus Kapaibacterium sp.]
MNITDLINPYAYAMRLRRYLFRQKILRFESVSVPVISVGNLSMGGTGKTPITLCLGRYCIETLQKKAAIVLLGYKRKSTGFLLVSNGNEILEKVARSGDEAQLYAMELPEAIVICDEDRVRGAQNAVALGAEVILLDDGFQHLRLKRDLNVLLINSDEGIPPVLPFGKGREDRAAIKDADVIIQTNYGQNSGSFISDRNKPLVTAHTSLSSITLYSGDDEIDALSEILSGNRILAVSGIANPERFERSLREVASEVIAYRLGDHAEYDTALLHKIAAEATERRCEFIATTTKDAVKMLDSFRAMQRRDSSLLPIAVIHSDVEFISGSDI